ncbi:MAG TPA: tetratricopeptide repeat protein [Rhodocyclaceae bacterium]|nr:tetratricopeptide repeat protein [Rhodocyclaceae bacterium]
MANRLIIVAAFAAATVLSGCAVFRPSTEDMLTMQDHALRAYDQGDDAKAESLYLGIIKQAPDDAESWFRLGNLYARSDRPDNAAEAYQRALLLNPNDERAWYNLGVIRQRQAHAAFIQAWQLTHDDDPLHARSAAMIKQLDPNTKPQTDSNAQSPGN